MLPVSREVIACFEKGMTAQSREIEFKFAVADRRAFDQLIQHLKLPGSLLDGGVTQTNHFFDSPARCLHENHFVIRLREAGGINTLTIKGERQTEDIDSEVLSSRIEEEVDIPREAADDLLSGRISPLQAVSEHFKSRSAALLEMIENACDRQDFVHIGQFNNLRIKLPPVSLHAEGADETVVFELDTSTFPGYRTDHEIEVEISAHVDAALIEAALIDLLRQAGIEWQSAPSKAVRFFAALAGE